MHSSWYLWRSIYENESTRSCCNTAEHFQQKHFGVSVASDVDNDVDSDANGADDDQDDGKRKKFIVGRERKSSAIRGYTVKFM